MLETPPDKQLLPLDKVIDDIIYANQYIHDFWQSGGWAIENAAELLRRARLDRQVSLSRCLRRWTEEPPAGELEGHLILAWANLGALMEGTMTWFLCVFASDYARTPWRTPRGDEFAPDDLRFETMIRYFATCIWGVRSGSAGGGGATASDSGGTPSTPTETPPSGRSMSWRPTSERTASF
jgi:hypothetical protein